MAPSHLCSCLLQRIAPRDLGARLQRLHMGMLDQVQQASGERKRRNNLKQQSRKRIRARRRGMQAEGKGDERADQALVAEEASGQDAREHAGALDVLIKADRQPGRQGPLAEDTSGAGSCAEWAGWAGEILLKCVWTGQVGRLPQCMVVGLLQQERPQEGSVWLCVKCLCGHVRQVQPGNCVALSGKFSQATPYDSTAITRPV